MPKLHFSSLWFGLFVYLLSITALAADRIETVSDIGKVNFRDYRCKEAKDEYVQELCYAKKSRALIAKLDNKFYGFCGVPKSVHTGWQKSTNKKSYFQSRVKEKYACL